ncbi:unnamed protein product [Echinostoma caproni]|uniref:Chorein_N domain-containing protein n=1 Tax=Echinostoma caproni TaxID=27848 RepID=A0A183ALI6_9TREM|nr:unnamed protein product [Echinostoma caproni]
MVFESLIVDLINRYLGSYIETLNASQLKIGLLGGNAKLENLDIKANAFDDLNLPVKVLQGHIGLFFDIENSIKEKEYAREAKKKELRAIEEARTYNLCVPYHPKSDSFGEKLAAQIVKNLQIDIRNVHIRYEDNCSIPGQIFSLGITLIRKIQKLVSVIVSSCTIHKVYPLAVLCPISSTAMLHVHTRPEETDFTVPQLDLSVDFSEIDLNFSLHQYHDVTCFLDATDRIITQNKYRKYRPESPLRGNSPMW